LCHGTTRAGPAGISGLNSIQRANLARTSPEAAGMDYDQILERNPSSPAATTQHGPKDFASNVHSSLQKIISKGPLVKHGSAIAQLPPAEERLLEGQIDKVRRAVCFICGIGIGITGEHTFVTAGNATIATLLGGLLLVKY
jgi:hypothetical protein